MTFEELHYYVNDLIVKKGFLNLDFHVNFKHFSKSGLNAVSKALPRRKQ